MRIPFRSRPKNRHLIAQKLDEESISGTFKVSHACQKCAFPWRFCILLSWICSLSSLFLSEVCVFWPFLHTSVVEPGYPAFSAVFVGSAANFC